MTGRHASSRLIGRSAELAELEAALAEAAAGRPSLALVAGESGLGKTRLLGELARRARDAGTLVLAGDAIDLGGEELAYLPLVAALRPLARASDPALNDAVAPLLPGAPAPAEPGSQARLFEGLLTLLDDLGRERPVLLVLEDLHWVDRSTRAALAFLARNLTGERVLIVGSYRPDELPRRHPLRPLLADLELDPRTRRIRLAPFSRDELAEQLGDILGAPPAPEQLERLWTRSGGNPLFGEELLAAGRDGGGAAPDTLRDALMLRVERLSAPARELLPLLAVGERLDHPLLDDTSPLDPGALRDALREAVDAQIVAVHDDGSYRFRHALLREVVEADVLPGERAALHLTIARALERRLDGESAAQPTAVAAHHFAAAGDHPAALRFAVRAAEAAERVHAHDEAAALLERAAELWDRVPDAEALAGADRVALLVRAAGAAAALGAPGRQLALLETAFAELGPEPDPRRAASILEATARAQRHLNRGRESIATLERALDLVERDDDRTGLLAGLARSHALIGRFGVAAELAREALQAAAEAEEPLVEGNARNTLGFSLAMIGAVDEGAAELRKATELARAHGSLSDLGLAYNNHADVLHRLGRSAEARAIATEGRRAVVGRRPIETLWLDNKLAEITFDLGEWEAAEALLPAAQRWTGTQTRLGLGLFRATLALGRGEQATAEALVRELEPMAAESSEPQVLGPFGVVVAELRFRAGDLAAARGAIEEWLARIDAVSDAPSDAAALSAMGVMVEAAAADGARDVRDAQAESAALRRLDEWLARIAAAATPSRPVERALLAGARADAARAAGRPDPAAYARAAAAWDEIGRPLAAARLRLREAEAHAAAGDREAAAVAARAAHAVAVRLGAGWVRQEVERLAARARFALEPGDAAPEPSGEDPFGLTARERQVLALVAEGATNRQIGEKLFMAEKTASVHVSRILVKLNARSRTEAATVAHRHRLLDAS